MMLKENKNFYSNESNIIGPPNNVVLVVKNETHTLEVIEKKDFNHKLN
jgi:hypothetical protein